MSRFASPWLKTTPSSPTLFSLPSGEFLHKLCSDDAV
ncbi:hypothetical protein A2U01_0096842, partial [Trifolium medium]|nr:hypothetical protein [Trifolium medium]